MNSAVSSFLSRHNFVNHLDILSLSQGIRGDMIEGLRHYNSKNADQDMIRTFCNPPSQSAEKKSVIVIDAGGTNFRSCLVTFDSQGIPEISFMEKTKMPGIEKELSKKEFFNQIAQNIERLKDKSDRIGFCFSYPMEIKENGDGILLGFSKEVKAPEVIGSEIGKCLKAELLERGWKSIKRISLCNDTVAALLAGAAISDGNKYSSYIGMILGTGLNAAYIQPENSEYKIKKQIVVCESGKYTGVSQSDFDKSVDLHTVKPGSFLLEKLCSGAYLGTQSMYALKTAAEEKLFSEKICKEISKIESLSLIESDSFLHSPYNSTSTIGKILYENNGTDEDYDRIYQILDAIVERSARCAAAILISCVIQTGEGKKSSKPVCILCNGTTFFKTYKIEKRVHGYLDEILTKNMGIYWKIVCCENDITLGAAISGLID